MKLSYSLFLLILSASLMNCYSNETLPPRLTEDFNFDWKFHWGELEGAQSADYPDGEWKAVRLPHDWSVAFSFREENAAGATGFLPGGIGWYRKTFTLPIEAKKKITWIEFDGVYSNSDVWINGAHLGKHPYGYTPFKYDLTEHLKYGEPNQIAVRVDRSAYIDCRWYPGSGIYRNVKLVTANRVHIPQWGTFITTPRVSKDKASVTIQTDLANKSETEQTATVRSTVYFENEQTASIQSEIRLIAGKTNSLTQEVEVLKPNLWGTETPHMYRAVTEVYLGQTLVDRYETPFGIRHFTFDKDKGFFLNGENMLFKGVCLHHDGGLVGSAVPIGVWERRLRTLKNGGCNAIRTAHNPPSEEFLDLCDRMGFLVQDEAFDEWYYPKDKRHNYSQQEASPLTTGYTKHFPDWAERDLKSMVLRDRNHPSIIMWSIGNEIEWTYPRYGEAPGYWDEDKPEYIDYYWNEPPYSIEEIKKNFHSAEPSEHILVDTAKDLTQWIKELDTTRPVSANLVIPSVSNFSGYSETLDVVGLSYRQSVYDYSRRHYPDMIYVGTENWTRYHEWKPVLEKDFISGIFLWTGINYMGESSKWPTKGSGSGLLDFAGFEKPSYQMFKTLWSDEPHLHITTQVLEKSPYKWDEENERLVEKELGWAARQKWGWQEVSEHWNYQEGQKIAVEVYSNQEQVELFLDGKSLGAQRLSSQEDRILKWLVPYSDGKLTAKAVSDPSVAASIQTAGPFSKLLIEADTTELRSNAYDVAHITVQLADVSGTPIRYDDKEVVFHIEGDAKLLGVDNGAPTNIQDIQIDRLVTASGRALMILQSNRHASSVRVSASCGDVASETIDIAIN